MIHNASTRPNWVHINPNRSDEANRAAATIVWAVAMPLVRTEVSTMRAAIADSTPSVAA
jgi:hypothetical protein